MRKREVCIKPESKNSVWHYKLVCVVLRFGSVRSSFLRKCEKVYQTFVECVDMCVLFVLLCQIIALHIPKILFGNKSPNFAISVVISEK